MIRVTAKPLRLAFGRRLEGYRADTARHSSGGSPDLPTLRDFPDGSRDRPSQVPDPLAPKVTRAWLAVSALVLVFLAILAGFGGVAYYMMSEFGPLGPGAGGLPVTGAPDPRTANERPGLQPAVTVIPEITPEAVRAGLLKRPFYFRYERGKVGDIWVIEPGEIKDLEIVRTQTTPDGRTRSVDAKVTLEDDRHVIKGVLTLTYTRADGGWRLTTVRARDYGTGKSYSFEVTDKK
jgi:hypothetical protein